MITKSTIDNVFETARLEEVIGDFVQLKKSGSNFKGLSPFSDERTPSFMVSPAKQIWKDFSSGKGGNVVAFLMEHEHFSYPEAIKYLAKKYNIEVEETLQTNEQKQASDKRESMYLVAEYAQEFFGDSLWKTESGKAIGLSYFKERGFSDQTIKNFKLGYSPNEWSAFTNIALKRGFKEEFLAQTGLTIIKEDKKFDRFKGRVMFPIHSMSGRVLGFGGRILTSDNKVAKYVNSPESDIYHKSKVLYGIYYAKQSIAKEDNCYLVEGYTDVIQMYQSGITNVVASSGTALTSDQIRLISRLTQNITVLFDGDAAGIRASLRGINLILEAGLNVKVCTFPEGEDPDSFSRKSPPEELSLFLSENAKDFIQFKASLLAEEAQNDPIKKADTIREIVLSISKIPDPIKRELYIRSCASIMDISEDVLFATLSQSDQKVQREFYKKRSSQAFEVIKKTQKPSQVDVRFELEQNIIKILLMYGSKEVEFEDVILQEDESTGQLKMKPTTIQARVFEKIYLDLQQDEIELATPQFGKTYQMLLEAFQADTNIQIETLLTQLDVETSHLIAEILMNDEHSQLHNWERKNIFIKDKEETIGQWLNQTILNLRCHLINQKVGELQKQTQGQNNQSNIEILEEVKSYSELKKLLSERLDRVL